MKVIISTGIGKLHFHETARAAALGGAEVEFVTGWVPSSRQSAFVNSIGRILGEASLAKRLHSRVIEHPHVTVRSVVYPEFLGHTMARLFQRFIPPQELSGLAFGMAGAASRKWLHDADIFHVRSGAGQGGAIRTARRNGMKIITDHSIAHPAYMEEVLNEEFRRLGEPFDRVVGNGLWTRVLRDCDDADRLLVNSDFVKRTFVEKGYPADKIDVVYLGVREQFYSIKKEYSIQGPARLLYTGNFSLRKGAATVLDSIRLLRKDGVDVRLRVIGSISSGLSCIRESDSEFFTHTPFVPPDQLIPALAEGDIFVFPTLIEGSSRSAMEAAAAGLPIVTTENCGLPLEADKEVIYVPLTDPSALADAIARLVGNQELRQRLGQSAAIKIQQNFTWNHFAEELMRVYSSLLGGRSH